MSGPGPIRVQVVNDFTVVTAGVAAMLEPYADRVRVLLSSHPSEPADGVQVVLYDLFGALPVDRTRIIDAVLGRGAQLIVYSWAHSRELVESSLEAGASGYVSKTCEPEELVTAVEAVAGGQQVVSEPSRPGSMHWSSTWPGSAHSLSAREAEVVALIARGLSNQEIADVAYLSVNSVKTYARTAYRKMGVVSRSQAVLWALAHGFAPTPTSTPTPGPAPASTPEPEPLTD